MAVTKPQLSGTSMVGALSVNADMKNGNADLGDPLRNVGTVVTPPFRLPPRTLA